VAIEPGQQLLHYRIVKKIGKGGMGEVYVAEDTKLNRQVALKVLPEKMAADPDRRARFEREAKSVAAFNHPNIVTIHSVEEAEGVHFITMELVEGQTLSQMLPRKGLTTNQLLEIAIPLADAVSRAHREGITHRDLKPDNIMIDSEGRLRVLDFGLAKLQGTASFQTDPEAPTATAVTEEGKILGTVAYMSPEQAEGKEVGPRSDVFSLGTILYELATGARPFKGDTNVSTIGAILKDQPVSVTELKPALPNHLGRIFRRCLAKNPDRRYQTALGLLNELQELKEEIDSGAHLRAPVRAGRNMTPWIVAGICAVIAIGALLTVTQWNEQESSPTVYDSRPLTGAIGWETDVSWSPEAEFIAFSQLREGSLDVMVQPVAAGSDEMRAGGPGDETSPRWSSDGRYLAYVSSSEPGSHIYLVQPHSGTPRKLIATNVPALDVEKSSNVMGDRPWSQDGRTLLVARVSESGQTAIYRVNRESGEAEQLTFPPIGSSDLSPSYSFDGKRIVFQRRTHGKGALLTMRAEGGEPEVLLADGFDNLTPAWRPDNRHVLFASNRGGAIANLWEIDSSTGSLKQMTAETKNLITFSVSADDRVAVCPHWHDTFLFEVDVATRARRQLTSHTKDNFGARYSPDGKTIAYHSTRTGNSEIWLHHMDERPEMPFTDDPSWDLYADWSPNGDQLIYVSDREDNRFKIFIANSDGGGTRRLTNQPITVRSTWAPVNAELVSRWSPDGSRIAYLVTGDEAISLWTIKPDGESARERLENVMGFDWYLDSRRAIYTRPYGSESELVAVDLETGEEQTLFVGPLMEIDVAPDGSAVSFCYGRGHMGMGLAILELRPPAEPDGLPRAAGEPEIIVRAEENWHVHNGGWSPDSKRLVYTQDMDYGDIYEIIERE
jgi:serine/threonine protein kinase